MGKEIPKPYLEIAGKSILGHTLSKFKGIEELVQVIVVTSPDYIDTAKQILSDDCSTVDCLVISGGDERQQSVLNALMHVSEESELVAVHDAVRPFVSHQAIKNCLHKASGHKLAGAIVAVPARDTVKVVGDKELIQSTPDRRKMWLAQTPQVFKKDKLRKAYEFAFRDNFLGTDDASLVERLGERVAVVEGDIQNFKITFPLDLQLASIILSEK